ncbi:hypothetical protein ZWY2020_006459 [Hordeum vulgare]|nr:hypothetical protein ZWY2020_006459 [Hordeum vulgare]
MGNCRSSSCALLGKAHVVPDTEWRIQDFGKTHVPSFEWRIQDFSSLLKTGAKRATSGAFHCSGYNWFLQVIPMHKEAGSETPYVALRLVPSQLSLVPGHTVHAVYELSIYNHSKGMYCGCKGTLACIPVVTSTALIASAYQKNGKHFTGTSDLWVCGESWGWPNFFGLKNFKDPSGGYVVGSSCIVKADLTIVGSSNDG